MSDWRANLPHRVLFCSRRCRNAQCPDPTQVLVVVTRRGRALYYVCHLCRCTWNA